MRRLGILCLLLLLSANAAAANATTSRHVDRHAAVVLLGDRGTGKRLVRLPAGRTRAYPLPGARAGVLHSVSIFVARHSRAKRLTVGIYSNGPRRPGTLVRRGSARAARHRGWTKVHLRAARLHRSRTYWVAVVGNGGTLAYRAGHRDRCTVATGHDRPRRSLPTSWRIVHPHRACPLSAHIDGQAQQTKRHKPKQTPGGTPSPAPPGNPAPPGTVSPPANCSGTAGSAAPDYATIDACGFPSPDTTGVPPGTALTPIGNAALPAGASWSNGALEISGNGVTVSGVSVTDGTVQITGQNDTITNSFISSSDSVNPTILVYDGASNTTLSHDELEAPDSEQGVVNNAGQEPMVIENSYLHNNCTGVLGANVVAVDNYIITDTIVSDCHVEDVYVPGGTTAPTDVEHNTLLNPQGQTAAVFLDNHAYGPDHNVTIDDNLMGGGGYVTYGTTDGDGSSNIAITNNRFTRLYFPDGGFYGAENQNDDATTFTQNIWDGTLKPVLPNH